MTEPNPARVDDIARFLATGATRALVVRPIGTGLAFITHITLARVMGATEYGAFIYVYFWTFFLGLLARLGLDRSAVRFGTALLAQGNFAEMRALLRFSFLIALGLGVAGAAALGLAVTFWPWDMGTSLRSCFLTGTAVIPLLAVHNVYEGFAQAQKNIWQATIPEQVLRQSLLGVVAIAAYRFNGEILSATEAMLANVAAVALTLVVDWTWYRWARPPEVARVVASPARREWLTYAAQMSAATNVGTWILQADLVLVGALLGSASASLYSAASRISSLVAWVGVAATLVFGPIIAELTTREPAALQHYTRLVARGMGFMAVCLALVLWFGHNVLLGLFGREFLAATVPLGILLVGNVIRELFGPAFAMLNLNGLQTESLLVLSASALLNLVLNVALIQQFGMTGAALATATTVSAYSFAFWRLVQSRLQIDTAIFAAAGARVSGST